MNAPATKPDPDPVLRGKVTATGPGWELRCGRWQDVLADVAEVDAVITDPPYGERTHAGHDDAVRATRGLDVMRTQISYTSWGELDVASFVDGWAHRCHGWFVSLTSHDLHPHWETAYRAHGLTSFAPVVALVRGMTVRLAGDGPSSWALYASVARPKSLCRWGTLPGGYYGPPGERQHIGGKPLWLMQALIRDYTKPGDLVCDPCAGGGTTLLAAVMEGRRAIGAEMDPETFAKAKRRLEAGYTPDLFAGAAS